MGSEPVVSRPVMAHVMASCDDQAHVKSRIDSITTDGHDHYG